ncbi:hypothetical protein G6F62_015943 [Rhizopus arrhizus]|nr:hypothetical protein G6F62_015943 [Rhizopus arrhizus]
MNNNACSSVRRRRNQAVPWPPGARNETYFTCRLDLRRPFADRAGGGLRPAGGRGAGAERDRLRPLRAG